MPSFGQIVRDQMKLPIAADLIDTALEDDAKKNLY